MSGFSRVWSRTAGLPHPLPDTETTIVTRVFAAAILVLATIPYPAIGDDRRYEIKLDRPCKVGDEFVVTATFRRSSTQTVTLGKDSRDSADEFAYELQAAVKVLEVDDAGRTYALSLDVTQCTRSEGPTTTRLVEKPTVVLGSLTGKEGTFTVDGRPVDKALGAVLEQLVPWGQCQRSKDRIFGTTDRKRVGDQWPINTDLDADDLADSPFLANAKEDVKASSVLEKITAVDGVECMVVTTDVKTSNLDLLKGTGLTVDASTVKIHGSSILPVDTALGAVERSSTMSAHVTGSGPIGPNGQTVRTDTTVNDTSTWKFTYPKPAPGT